jgi:hypothetical protein
MLQIQKHQRNTWYWILILLGTEFGQRGEST